MGWKLHMKEMSRQKISSVTWTDLKQGTVCKRKRRNGAEEKGVAGVKKEDGRLSWGAPEGNLCGENKRIIRLGRKQRARSSLEP